MFELETRLPLIAGLAFAADQRILAVTTINDPPKRFVADYLGELEFLLGADGRNTKVSPLSQR